MGTDKAEIVESRQDIRQFYCDERRICRMPEDIRQSDPRARLNCRTLAEHSTIHQPPAPHHAQRSIEKGAAHLAKTKDAAPSICLSKTFCRNQTITFVWFESNAMYAALTGFCRMVSSPFLYRFIWPRYLSTIFSGNTGARSPTKSVLKS